MNVRPYVELLKTLVYFAEVIPHIHFSEWFLDPGEKLFPVNEAQKVLFNALFLCLFACFCLFVTRSSRELPGVVISFYCCIVVTKVYYEISPIFLLICMTRRVSIMNCVWVCKISHETVHVDVESSRVKHDEEFLSSTRYQCYFADVKPFGY